MNPLKVCPQCGTEYPANARFCEIDGTALRSAGAEQDMVGSIVADRYHVMKKLGEGGMGQVYLAEHVKMGRKSALKVMHPSMKSDVDAISRFNREAANASRISHPNVAAVYDFGETPDGLIYLAMEFVDGPPLTKVIEQQGALPPKRAAEMTRQVGEALAAACDLGIVHRDLKPDNIMVAKTRDGGDLVKVVDFGIAKAAGNEAQKVTKTGLVVGTPEYMSPEQLAGDKIDGRSDIYSLGLVAFNMLTGKLPFPSDSAQESMIMRLTDKPKPLIEMNPQVQWPADVQAVMDRALERDVNKRYQTASEFGRALYQAVDRMPETVAAEMGTAVMSAVPATRVSSSLPGKTVAMGAPVAATPQGQSPAAQPQGEGTKAVPVAVEKRSKAPMLVGAVAVVAIAGFGAMKMWGGSAGAGSAGKLDTAANSGVFAPPQASTNLTPSEASGQSGVGPPSQSPAANTTTKNAQSSPSPSGMLLPQLAQLAEDAADSTKAPGILKKLKGMTPTTSEERAAISYARFRALETMEDTTSCTAIQEAVKLSTDPTLKARYKQHAAGCGGG